MFHSAFWLKFFKNNKRLDTISPFLKSSDEKCLARYISLYLNVMLKVEILEHWNIGKDLPQLDKGLASIKN